MGTKGRRASQRRYKVDGWSIRPAMANPTPSTPRESQSREVAYEVKFVRVDNVRMEQVMKHPTAAEVDDYSEYKRLKCVHRDGKHAYPMGIRTLAKLDSPISPVTSMLNTQRLSPNTSRANTFKLPTMSPSETPHETPLRTSRSLLDDSVNPFFVPVKNDSPSSKDKSDSLDSFPVNPRGPVLRSPTSLASSDTSLQVPRIEELREIVPWIDYDAQLIMPSHELSQSPPSQELSRKTSPIPRKASKAPKIISQFLEGSPSPEVAVDRTKRRESKWPKLGSEQGKVKSTKISLSVLPPRRNRNPLARVLDGSGDATSDDPTDQDYFSCKLQRSVSHGASSTKSATNRPRLRRASSSDGTLRPLSPIPVNPLSPVNLSPLITDRRQEICLPFTTAHHLAMSLAKKRTGTSSKNTSVSSQESSEDPFLSDSNEISSVYSRPQLPSLKSFMAGPSRPISGSVTSGSFEVHVLAQGELGGVGSPSQTNTPQSSMFSENQSGEEKIKQGGVMFRNPFKSRRSRDETGETRRSTEHVAPEDRT